MNKKNYIQILEKPEFISLENSSALKSISQQYPYFQSAKALHLKVLKNQDSYKYNSELKITAAHTSDRTLLFDFITSKSFKETSSITEEKISLKEILLPKKKIKETYNIERRFINW